MKDFPFSVHDFFAYFASGLLLLVIVGYAFDFPWKMPEAATIQLVLVVVVAYVVGQVLSYLSGLVIEQFFVTWFLGRTDVALLGLEATKVTPCSVTNGRVQRCKLGFENLEEATVSKDEVLKPAKECAVKKYWKEARQKRREDALFTLGVSQTYYKNCQFRTARRRYRSRCVRRTVFRKAYEPLPPGIRKSVLARAKSDDVEGAGVISRAQASAKTDDRTFARMGTFLYLYEFARNACMAFIVGCVVLVSGSLYYRADGNLKTKLCLALLCAAAAVIMLFRYLDFHRRYNLEVFKAYAYPTSQRERAAGE